MENINKNKPVVKKNFLSVMPFDIAMIFVLSKLIGWFGEAVSFYFTQKYFIEHFPTMPAAAFALGALSDFSKCLAIIYVFLYPINHVAEKFEIGWNAKTVIGAWFENAINTVLSIIKTVAFVIKKELSRILIWGIVAQGVYLSVLATASALTVDSWEASRESGEYKTVQESIGNKKELIADLKLQNQEKQNEINLNNRRIESVGDELTQTRYKGIVYANEQAYQQANERLSAEIAENNRKIEQLGNDISNLGTEAVKIEKSDVGAGNIFYKGIASTGGLGIQMAIYLFGFGIELIAGYFLGRWVIENRFRILEWINHIKKMIKINDAIKFAQRQQAAREKYLLAIGEISERGNFGVSPEVIASVIRSGDMGDIFQKLDGGSILTDEEIKRIDAAINRTKALPPPVEKSLPAEQMNRMLVNGRPMTDDEKKELAGAMENMPGVYDDDTPEYKKIRDLSGKWKAEEARKFGFNPGENSSENQAQKKLENSSEIQAPELEKELEFKSKKSDLNSGKQNLNSGQNSSSSQLENSSQIQVKNSSEIQAPELENKTEKELENSSENWDEIKEKGWQARLENLSKKERKIVQLANQESPALTLKQIGIQVGLGESAVSKALSRLGIQTVMQRKKKAR